MNELILIGSALIGISLVILALISLNPSGKHGGTLKLWREKAQDTVKYSKVVDNFSILKKDLTKKAMVRLKNETPPDYSQYDKKNDKKEKSEQKSIPQPQVSNNAVKITTTHNDVRKPYDKATFYYDASCGDYRLGDTYIDNTGKNREIMFEIVPYTYKNVPFFSIENPRYQPNHPAAGDYNNDDYNAFSDVVH